MPAADAIRATIDQYVARFSAGDRDAWLELFADDATVEDPVGSPVRKGRSEIGEFFDFSHSLADSIELRPHGIVNVCGDEAAWVFQIRATVAGAVYAVTAVDAMTFDDDAKIASMRAYWDAASMTPADD